MFFDTSVTPTGLITLYIVATCPYFLALVPESDADTCILLLTVVCLSIGLLASNQQKLPEVAFFIYKTNIRT